jgi:hypothetical protein
MAKKKSDFLSGLGTGFEILKAITNEVHDLGGTDADVRSILSDSDKRRRVAELLSDHYRITVTSTATPTYAELCKAYDWVSELWDESKFTLELHVSLRKLTPSTGDKIIFLQKFNRATTSEDAIAWGQTRGYRPAFPCEREAFSKANPDLQKKFWIVDLGSFALYGGRRGVSVLCGDGGERDLGCGWFDYEWDTDDRFLFVRE